MPREIGKNSQWLSKNRRKILFLSENCRPKMQNLTLKASIWGKFRSETEILSTCNLLCHKLQFSVPPTFSNPRRRWKQLLLRQIWVNWSTPTVQIAHCTDCYLGTLWRTKADHSASASTLRGSAMKNWRIRIASVDAVQNPACFESSDRPRTTAATRNDKPTIVVKPTVHTKNLYTRSLYCTLRSNVLNGIAFHEKHIQSYWASPTVGDHTMLLATRHS